MRWVNGHRRLIEVEPVFPVTVMEATQVSNLSFQKTVCLSFLFTFGRIGLQSTTIVFQSQQRAEVESLLQLTIINLFSVKSWSQLYTINQIK